MIQDRKICGKCIREKLTMTASLCTSGRKKYDKLHTLDISLDAVHNYLQDLSIQRLRALSIKKCLNNNCCTKEKVSRSVLNDLDRQSLASYKSTDLCSATPCMQKLPKTSYCNCNGKWNIPLVKGRQLTLAEQAELFELNSAELNSVKANLSPQLSIVAKTQAHSITQNKVHAQKVEKAKKFHRTIKHSFAHPNSSKEKDLHSLKVLSALTRVFDQQNQWSEQNLSTIRKENEMQWTGKYRHRVLKTKYRKKNRSEIFRIAAHKNIYSDEYTNTMKTCGAECFPDKTVEFEHQPIKPENGKIHSNICADDRLLDGNHLALINSSGDKLGKPYKKKVLTMSFLPKNQSIIKSDLLNLQVYSEDSNSSSQSLPTSLILQENQSPVELEHTPIKPDNALLKNQSEFTDNFKLSNISRRQGLQMEKKITLFIDELVVAATQSQNWNTNARSDTEDGEVSINISKLRKLASSTGVEEKIKRQNPQSLEIAKNSIPTDKEHKDGVQPLGSVTPVGVPKSHLKDTGSRNTSSHVHVDIEGSTTSGLDIPSLSMPVKKNDLMSTAKSGDHKNSMMISGILAMVAGRRTLLSRKNNSVDKDDADEEDDDGEERMQSLVLGQSARDIEHCSCCKLGLWKKINPHFQFINLTMLLVTFADSVRNHPCHFTRVVHSHLTIYGLIQLIKQEVGIQSNTLTVFRDRSRSVEAEIPLDFTLEDCGLDGKDWYNPIDHVLYYDYTTEFNKCPILMSDYYFVNGKTTHHH